MYVCDYKRWLGDPLGRAVGYSSWVEDLTSVAEFTDSSLGIPCLLFFFFNCCLFAHSYELLIIFSSTFLSFILIMFLDRIGSHRPTLEHDTETENCLLSLSVV